MFSCCRANPKNSSTKSAKKDKHKKTNDADDDEQPETVAETTTTTLLSSDKKLIIPTITIENGKTCDDSSEQVQEEKKDTSVASSNGGGGDSSESDFKENSVKSENADLCSNETETATADIAAEADRDVDPTTTQKIVAQPNNTDDQLSKSSPKSFIDDCANSAINRVSATHSSTIAPEAAGAGAAAATESATDATATQYLSQEQQKEQEQQQQHTQSAEQSQATAVDQPVEQQPPPTPAPAPKSCLSRHNSTHTSIKKKVNISTHAEIIEPDPLPPPPPPLSLMHGGSGYDHGSLGDDDDVFSDSLPPPKRESMCAPYIETTGGYGFAGDELPDAATLAAAFAHGLPEWFNDERINDIGCIEPPVTPVGRDELELKRQSLYTDLLRAAHAAVEHSVRFTPSFGGFDALPSYSVDTVAADARTGDCDPDLKPSVAENLDHLVNRLERLVERLERSVSARELEIANRTFDTVLAEKKRESFDLETTELPPLPVADEQEDTVAATALNQRIERIESTLQRINDRHSSSNSNSQSSHSSASLSQSQHSQSAKDAAAVENNLEHIPTTVLENYSYSIPAAVEEQEALLPPPPPSMSVLGYQDIVSGPLSEYLALSAKIGGDVAKHAQFVKAAFDAQLQYVTLASQCAQPSQDKQMELLKPTSTQISAIQDFREKNRPSPLFNHLSAISESIPALGWVCVGLPGPHVKEMKDAGQFYTNRVLKEWKDKDAKHVEWSRAWVQTLTELQAYIKQYHTTGLVWSGKGSAAAPPPPPPIGACPPPPPPPAFDLAALSLSDGGGSADERSALFAQINQGENITRNLKKVTDDMQTHKNPTLRTGPAPFKTPAQFGSVGGAQAAPTIKEPVFTRDGKKWIIEHQKNNASLLVEGVEMNNVVYVFKCEGSTLTVKGKLNNIVMDSCKKCSLLCDSVVASIEFVNCQSVQMQVLGHVPTVSIDKTDGCQMYLSKDSLGVEIIQSKSSEMNVMLPAANGDYTELALPEQFKTTISGKTLKTVCVDSLG